ncbi:MAG: type IX secretion system membrane protein PorP/SprF, partial [Elusimicrobia bacterium]|nr:type IX secretion system membrane protein PorP/SprF [Elusimicrobiota bacterium]
MGQGARPGAMANAFTAVGGDIHGIFFNPAGLGLLWQPEIASMYSRLFMGLSDKSNIGVSMLGFGSPLGKDGRWGSLGLSLWRIQLESLFSEQANSAAYARRWRELFSGDVYLGLTVKHLTRSYGTTPEIQNAINLAGSSLGSPDPLLAKKRSKTGFGLDLGMLYQWHKYYSAGLAIQNINEPNMALNKGDKDLIPMVLKTGFAYRAPRTRFTADLSRRESIPGRMDYQMGFGAERIILIGAQDTLALRAGLASGSRDFRQVSLGLGYQFSRLALNYAFQIPLAGISRTDGSHQMSLAFRFGRPKDDEADLSRLVSQEHDARVKAEKAL